MTKTTDIQFRILIPVRGKSIFNRNQYWGETCFGHWYEKVYSKFESHIPWFWFTRYQIPTKIDTFVFNHVKKAEYKLFFAKGKWEKKFHQYYRCIYIRMRISFSKRKEFESATSKWANSMGYRAIRFESYDLVGDLGSDRFAWPKGVDVEWEKRIKVERSEDAARYLFYSARLLYGCLTLNDKSQFVPEKNGHKSNHMTRSTLESHHHMFCNMTNVPTPIFQKGKDVGTRIYPNPKWDRKEKGLKKVKVYF